MKNRGFTIIELLMVIAIIGILASIVLISTLEARERAKVAKARAEIHSIRTASELIVLDMGKYPAGCPTPIFIGMIDFEQFVIADPKTGFLIQPDQYFDNDRKNCGWTNADILKWRGPYLSASLIDFEDPWGKPYEVDYDYFGASGFGDLGEPDYVGPGCPERGFVDGVAYVSHGRDGQPYTCDDIVLYLVRCDASKPKDISSSDPCFAPNFW